MNDEELIWENYELRNIKKKKLTDAFLAKQARIFFSQKDDAASKLISVVQNKEEMRYRLTWLSEGSLKYHLMGIDVPHGGDPFEKKLYRDFQEYLEKFRTI
jgi:hypothetical protein